MHHADVPQVELDGGHGWLFAGELDGMTSPARADTPLIGLDLTLQRGTSIVPTSTTFEYAVVPLDGRVRVGPEVVEEGWLALVPPGIDELPLEVSGDGARLLVLGGVPLGERIEMWWNFVARDKTEMTTAWQDWRDRTERFGDVDSALPRIAAPRPPWLPARDDE